MSIEEEMQVDAPHQEEGKTNADLLPDVDHRMWTLFNGKAAADC